jgi:hypothetical protein
VLAASASALLGLSGRGVVLGGLEPCSGIVVPNSPHYAAGTITVLRGYVAWKDSGADSKVAIFPTAVAGQQVVGTNGVYWFLLGSGDYVLEGQYTAGGGSARPWVVTTVTSGSIAHVDIPNMCI